MVSLGRQLPVTWVDRPGPAGHCRRDDEELPRARPATPRSPARTRPSPSSGSTDLRSGGEGGARSSRCRSPTPISRPSPTAARTSRAPSATCRPPPRWPRTTVETILHVKPSHRLRLAGRRCDRPLDRRRRHLRRGAQGDRPQRQPPGDRRASVHAYRGAADRWWHHRRRLRPRLSTAFNGDMSKAGDSTLAVQKFLAQTLADRPSRTPTRSAASSSPRSGCRPPLRRRRWPRALQALTAERWTQPLDLTAPPKAKPDSDGHHQGPQRAPGTRRSCAARSCPPRRSRTSRTPRPRSTASRSS